MGRLKKDKSKLIILIALLTILLGILVIIKYTPKKENIKQQTNNMANLSAKKDYKSELVFSGFGIFFEQFTGDLMSSDILSEVKKITVKHIPKMYDIIKGYDEGQLDTFYYNNSKNIKSMFGIQDLETFKHFAEGLQAKDVKIDKYIRLDILKDTFKNESDISGYAYVEYEVTYEGEKVIPFSLYVSKNSKSDVVYMIDTLNDSKE